MRAYYNEHDPKKAAWLRELIADGQITNGDVDERSITDVQPGDLRGYARCHFFAGVGVWDYALDLAGWGDEPAWTFSCPCQPFSAAGKRLGEADERHLWPVMFSLVSVAKPGVCFGEQVSSKDGLNWFCGVKADLNSAGYRVAGVDLPAAAFGAPHMRQRLFFVAERINR